MFDLDAIRAAETTLQGRFRRTELIYSDHFSERLGYPLFFKCENLQRTGSFKIRGALNFLANQPAARLQNGLVTASAGNHAQGVAFAATQAGIPALVVMPENTPIAKILATRDYGAEVKLHGLNYDEAAVLARQMEKERGMLAEGRFLMVRVELDDSPGALARLADLVAEIGANIFHVSHDRRNTGVPLGQAEVHLELETKGPEHIDEILAGLRDAGYGASILH
jgi:threonine dehydratase